MPLYKNAILDVIETVEPGFVRDKAVSFSLVHGDRLGEVGTAIEHVYFPQSGLASIVVALNTGEQIETGLIGRDCAIGASVACGATSWLSTCVVQITGQGLSVPAAEIVALVQRHPDLQRVFFAHEQYLLAQAQQIAACNARHHIPARLCNWFLRAQAAMGPGDLYVTQEFLAQILGVQRASVSLIAGGLQEEGLIHYRRGRLSIMDKDGVEKRACECHLRLREHQQRLFMCVELHDGDDGSRADAASRAVL